ncbi:MAG: PIN domain-containing protein [Actinomycetota bacterium]
MIYVDTSVILAQLLAEDRKPPAKMWTQELISSRLAEYETLVRIHSMRLDDTFHESARRLLSRLSMLELSPLVLGRALEPFPVPVRTLDALHLASIDYLISQRIRIRLATYDNRMAAAAKSLRIPLEVI